MAVAAHQTHEKKRTELDLGFAWARFNPNSEGGNVQNRTVQGLETNSPLVNLGPQRAMDSLGANTRNKQT
jgi:hypothetical protein